MRPFTSFRGSAKFGGEAKNKGRRTAWSQVWFILGISPWGPNVPPNWNCRGYWGPVHKYPGIFESATSSFRIRKFPRPHVSVVKSNLPIYTYPTLIRHISGFTLVPRTPLGILATESPLWRLDFKNCGFICRTHRTRVEGNRIRKEKVADSKISGYKWTRPYSQKKITDSHFWIF